MLETTGLRLVHPVTGTPLIDGASLAMAPGQVAVITAEAGAGTSLLLAALIGEHRPASGAVRVFGHDPYALRRGALRRLRRRIGVAPQALALVDGRDVLRQVALALEIDGAGRAATTLGAVTALERVGLLADRARAPGTLPSAARQRIGLARALVRGPELLLADQPTFAQDDDGVVLVAEAIADAAGRGAACVIVARDPRLDVEARRRGWRRLWLADGMLIEPDAVPSPAEVEIDLEQGNLELIVDARSAPRRRPAVAVEATDDAVPNVIQFPVTARSARLG